MRSWIITVIKIVITFSLLYWSYLQGHWDISVFLKLPQMKASFFCAFILLLIVQLLVCLRWYVMISHFMLRKGKKTFLVALKIVLVSNFFNTFLPGSIAGDVLRANYRVELDPHLSKKTIWITSLFDRFVGLFGLLYLGGLGSTLYLYSINNLAQVSVDQSMSLTAFRSLLYILEFTFFAMTVCYGALWLPKNLVILPFHWMNSLSKKIIHHHLFSTWMLEMISEMLIRLRVTFLLSLLVHIFVLGILFNFAPHTLIGDYSWKQLICAQSIGMVIASIPIAPGGAGVGHVAFNWAFHALGIEGGANLFNLFLMLLYLNATTGLIFFVFKKKKKDIEHHYTTATH